MQHIDVLCVLSTALCAVRTLYLHQATLGHVVMPLQSVPVTVLAIKFVTCGMHAATNEHARWTDLAIIESVALYSMFFWHACYLTASQGHCFWFLLESNCTCFTGRS